MTTLKEGAIQLRLPAEAQGRKFDDENHGLSCMKAVDFIVELPDRLFFIEFKDPEYPRATPSNSAQFINRFKSGQLDEDLKYKYRDTFLYQWASEELNKPVYYLVLVAIRGLTEAELLTRTEDLKRKLPLKGPASGTWKRKIAAGCSVFNIEAWNKHLPDYPITRIRTKQ